MSILATVMNREVELFDVEFDIHGEVLAVSNIRQEHWHLAPPLLHSATSINLLSRVIRWLNGRCIPTSRKHLNRLQEIAKVSHPLELSLKANALSLSDQYWVRFNLSENWEDLNFFDNPFSDDIGKFLTEGSHPYQLKLRTPGGTLEGYMPKRWKIRDGTRVLLKGSHEKENVESYREVFASLMFSQVLQPSEVTMYSLVEIEEGGPLSCCDNFINRDTELVTMYSLIVADGASFEDINYSYLKKFYKENFHVLDWMLMMDRILLNTDRHLNNFGFIRSSITGEILRSAPIFDTGISLFPRTPVTTPFRNPRFITLSPLNEDWEEATRDIDFAQYKEGLLKLKKSYKKLFRSAFNSYSGYSLFIHGKIWQMRMLNVIKENIDYLLNKC